MAMGELAEVVAARERRRQEFEREREEREALSRRQREAAEQLMPAIREALAAIGWKRLGEWSFGFETPEGVRLYLEPDVWPATA